MAKIFGAICLVLAIFLSGCVSDPNIVDADEFSLADAKRAVLSLMGDPRATSENQREFTSQYFSKQADPKFDANKAPRRWYSVVTVLGARRPYSIEVHAYSEVKRSGVYMNEGEDFDLGKTIAQQIRKRLNQSRDGRNVIDDFRAF